MTTEQNCKSALEILRKSYGSSIKLPSGINFSINESTCKIVLDAEIISKTNMQADCNAFEGWSIAMYIAMKKQGIASPCVELEISGDFDNKKGHKERFLYRALRFSAQYSTWFTLSDRLKNETAAFAGFMQKNILTNNIGYGDAGVKNVHNTENVIEKLLSENGNLSRVIGSGIVGSNKVYRQLPVGLFINEVSTDNAVFTGRHSAIDLWTWNGSVFDVVELKAHNAMMGLVTEIFFYSNYMRDLLTDGGAFSINKAVKNKNTRGYAELIRLHDDKAIGSICGIMLADAFHPIINEDFLNTLNANNVNIQYQKAMYNSDIDLSCVSISP